MKKSLIKFQENFPKNVDAVLVNSDLNRRYFTNMKSSAGVLLILRNKCYFIIDFRYIQKAKSIITDFPVLLQEKDMYLQITNILTENGVKNIAVETDTLTIESYKNFCAKLPNFNVLDTNEATTIINNLRAVKDDEEIECIQKSQNITDLAFSKIINYIKVGMTELEVAIELESYVKRSGAEDLGFSSIVVSGANSSLPHGVPTNKKINAGDFLTMDFGSSYNGYISDMTRTIGIGCISDKQKAVYDIVYNANMMSLEAIKPGVICSDIDKIARDYIYSNGYEGKFGHGLGHGVGLNVHENPRFSFNCSDLLAVGNIMTIEPGIYLENEFGVRIEDMVVITENGYTNFTKTTKELIIL